MLSNLEYLSYPLPSDIRRLSEAGDYERMAKVIADRLADPRVPKCLHERLKFELEIARLTPRYYPYTKEDIFERLQKKIPDITMDEIEERKERERKAKMEKIKAAFTARALAVNAQMEAKP